VQGDGEAVVAVRGELDMLTAPLLEEALADLDATLAVVIDCRELTFVDSTGLRAFIRGSTRFATHGGTLSLRNAGSQVRRLLAITQLEGLLERDGEAVQETAESRPD
jgi:anti-anti-sigma factor